MMLVLVLLATVLFSGAASATVVFDNYQALSNVAPNPPTPNYQNYQPTSDPNKSADQLQNLITLATGYNGASSGTATNIDWAQTTHTLCDSTVANFATAVPSCAAWIDGRVTYALVQFPVAGSYTFAVAHDDEVQVDFDSQFTAANAANYRNFNYNVPVGALTAYTTNDTTFQALPGNFQISQANSCYVMRVYWNNQAGLNDLHLQWTVPGQAAAIIPASALLDPSLPASYANCANTPTDLGIVKTGPATFTPGAQVTYTITVWNYGPATTSTANFSDTLPASLSAITFTCTTHGSAVCGTTTNNGNAYAVTTGALPLNTSAGSATAAPTSGSYLTYTVTATPSDVATIVNSATITNNDTNSANDTSSTTSAAASHNNTLTKIWSGATANNAVSLNITGTGVTNATAGTSTAPSTTTAATASASVGTTVNFVEAFTTGTAAQYATTLACVKNTDGTAVTVTGTGLSRSITEPTDSGVKCTYTNTLAANVSVIKTGPATVVMGASYTYSFAVKNSGGVATGTNVIFQDQLPAGVIATASSNTATCTPLNSAGALVTCTLPTAIAAGGTTTVTLTVTAPSTAGAITNYAAANPAGTGNPATAPGAACNTTTTSCSSAVTTVQAPVLTLTKSHTGNFTVGVNGVYTLTVSNSNVAGTAPTTGTVTVTDTLPTGLTYVSAAGTGWTCSATGQVVTCTSITAIAAGASAPAITLTVAVAAAAAPSVTNSANVSGGGDATCPSTARCAPTDPTTVVTAANVSVTKTGPATVVPGGSYSYTLAVANSGGTATGTNVIVRDQLPAGESATGSTNATCTPLNTAAALLTCTIPGPIAAAGSVSVTLTVTAPTTSGAITNYAATSPTGTGAPASAPGTACSTATTSCSSAATTVATAAAVKVTKTGPTTVVAGGSYTYTLAVANGGGTATSANVIVQDQLPAGESLTSAAGATCTPLNSAGALVTCTIATAIAANGSTNITLTVTAPTTGGSITNYAAASPTGTGNPATAPGAACNTSTTSCSSAATTVQAPVLNLTKTHTGNFTVGTNGAYTLTASNSGAAPTTGTVTVTDTLPTGLSYVSGTGTGWTCNATGQSVTCTSTTAIAAGASGSAITLTVGVAAAASPSVTNSATTSGGGDTTCASPTTGAAHCGASDATTVNTGANVTVNKTGPATVVAGASYTYTLAVKNTGGTATGANVVVQDQLPAGEQATGSTGATCTPLNGAGALVTCTIATAIAANGSTNITLTVTAPAAGGSITNYAAANPAGDGTNPATPPGTNCNTSTTSCSSAATTVQAPVLNLTKTHTGNFTVGTNGTYTLTASNSGNAPTTGTVTVTDTLPNGLTYVSGTGTGWTCNATGQSVTCTSTTAIAAGASGSAITLTVGVAAAASPSVTNSATTSGGGDTTCASPTTGAAHCGASDATTVNTGANVTVNKTGPATVVAGASYTYTLAVKNTGGTATGANVVVQDQLPANEQATSATGATCTPLNSAGALVTCTIATAIAANGSTNITLTVTAPAAGGSITNYAAASPTGTGNPATAPGTACNTSTTSCSSAATTVQAPVLNLTKTHTGNFTVGTNGAYTLTASNSGAAPTTGTVTVTDTLPTGLSYVSGTGTGWTCNATGQSVTCTSTTAIAAGASGSAITLTVGVAAAASPSVTNSATTSGGGDTTCASPTTGAAHCGASDATTVNTGANVTVNKTGPATVVAGASYTYTLAVKNTGGTATGANVVVQDQLPAGEQATGSTGATCTPLNGAGALVTCTIATAIAANGSTNITLTVTAPAAGGSITNYAAANPAGDGTNPATPPGTNCNTSTTSCSSAATTVQAPVLNLTKTHTGNFTVGTNGTYTLTASNSGNAPTTGTVTVTDTLPTGLSYVSGTGTGWTCNATGQSVTCTSTTAIAAGASGSAITLTVGVAAAASPSVTNSATTSGGGDTTCASPTTGAAHCGASDATTVSGTASLTLSKTSSVADTNGDTVVGDAGDTITYAFSITNTGTLALSNVKVTDPLLPSLGCTLTTLAAGATASCAATNNTYVITSTDVGNGKVSNTATATGTPPGGVTPPTASSSVNTPTTATPTTSITLSQTGTVADTNADGVTGDAGDVITYAFTAKNTGSVTLTNVVVTDPLLPNLTCTIASLAAGASATCAATNNTYTITSTDVGNGKVTSTATVTGTPPGTLAKPTATNTITTNTAATPVASFTITPTGTEADTNGDGTTGDAGDQITYTFSATNTGTVPLTNVVVKDPLLPNLTCTIASLAVGATASCTPTNNVYTITAQDVTNGSVVNPITATASAPTGVTPPPTESGTTTNPTTATPTTSITLSQTGTEADTNADGVTGDAGDVITYAFTAKNTGTVTLTNVVVTDPLLPNLTCTIASLAAGASATCAATNNTYTITSTDVGNGKVTSTATVTGTPPGTLAKPTATNTITTNTAATPVASFTITPTGTEADTNGDGTTGDAGDQITYTFSATNTGTVPLTNVVVKDPLLPNLTCTIASLPVGATASCTATNNVYTITAQDVTNGSVVNPITATASAPTGVTPPPTESGTTTNPTTATPTTSITLSQTGTVADTNADGVTGDAGDVITYAFTAKNTGTVTLTNVVVTDPLLPNLTCTIASLAAGASATCAATNNTYTITSTDVGNGKVTSTATVTGTPPGTLAKPTATNTITTNTAATPVASFTITPTGTEADTNGDGTTGDAGDQITYTFSATNTGTVPLTNVVVKDPLLPNLTCTIASLAVGATASCTATNNVYTITAQDVTNGSVVNPITATASAPTGVTPPPTESGTTTNPTTATPTTSITLSQTGTEADTNADGVTGDAGDVITYAFTAKNTGTVTLTNVVVTDPLLPNLTCTIASLAAGASATCAATNNTYTITSTDVGNGKVTSTATVTGTPPGTLAKPTDTNTITTNTAATPVASFTITPTGTEADTNGDGTTGDAGDQITYTFSATNTGTVPLTNVVVKDPLLPNLTCTIASLPVGATASCTATNNVYTITAQDVTNGSVVNPITATASAPTGVTPPPTESGTTTNPTTATPTTSITLSQTGTVADTNADGVTGDAGDVITYAFTAKNTGTVTLTNVVVTDPLLPNLTCTIASLAAGASATCAATNNTYTITSTDVGNGKVTSTATVTGTPPGTLAKPTATNTITTNTAATPVASFTITPTGTEADTNGDGTTGDAGDQITYTFSATNTGTVPLTNVVVKDPLLPNLTCTIASLPVGATASCTPTNNVYTITAQDVTNGSVVNPITATASAPTGVTPPPTESGTTTNPTTATPTTSITLSQTGTVADTNADGVTGDAGDVITYAFTAKNTGTVTLTNVVVTDPLLPNLTCTIASLAAGASATCAATNNTYTITSTDVGNGKVTSTATVTGTPPGTLAKPTATNTITTNTAATPVASFTITPTGTEADTNGDGTTGDAGDQITYTFSATNTGTVPLTNVVVKDPLLPNLTCTIASLAVGATASCTPTNNVYTITAQDVTNGSVVNPITATASAPTGVTPPPTESGTTTNPTTATPTTSITLSQTGTEADTNADGVTGDAGDVITYAFTAKNTGTVTLTNVVVTDPLLPNLTCTIASLAAGASATCAATNNTYTITSTDVGNGKVTSTATVTGTPPGTLAKPTATNTITTNTAATPVASFTITPTGTEADTNGDGTTGDAGDQITYTFSATNTGTVPLTNVVVKDPLLPNLTCTIASLPVGATASCTATNNVYTITAQDVTNGSVVNPITATASAPTGVTPPPTESGTTTNPTTATPTTSITLSQTGTVADTNADGVTGDAGDVITYAFTAKNTGTVTLTNVVVTDPLLPNLTCTIASLAAGASATCAATNNTYTITSTDVGNGKVTSTATVTGTPPGTLAKPTATNTITTNTAATPVASFTITPTGTEADTNGDGTTGDAGDQITYTFSATNTGTVPLTNVVVKDPLLPNLTCTIASLAVGATASCTPTNNVYTITAQDVTNGSVVNPITATASAPTGVTPPPTESGTTTNPTTATPTTSITLSQTGTVADTNADGVTGDAGDVITYAFTAKNTGTVTLTNVVVTDPLLPNLTCTIASLAAGASATCAATNNTYTITSTDVGNGKVTSTATVTGTPPGTLAKPTATNTITTNTAATPVASFTITPTGTEADTNGDGTTGDAGDQITYTFSATNTGTVPLTNVVVKDPLLPNLTCTIASLPVGATASCTATNNVYTITAQDVTNGSVVNPITATASAPTGVTPPPTESGTTTNPTTATPTTSITLSQTGTVADTNADGVTGDAGDVITYAFTAKNTGTVTLTNVVVTDPLLPNLTCTIASLAAGASATCAATNNTYTITSTDVGNGKVTSTATVTGTPPGTLAKPTATNTITTNTAATPVASFTITPTGTEADTNGDGTTGDAGDQITYTFSATNTGTVPLTNVVVKDPLLPNLTCTIASLAVGATASCTPTNNVYTITAQDVTNGSVVNPITATASAPTGVTPPPTESGTTTNPTTATPTASFTIKPTGTEADTNGDGVTGDAGDVITYTFTATNTGTVALTNVVIKDPLLPNLTCTIASLPVGATASCAPTNNTYTITAQDVTNGSVNDTANATATPPGSITPPTATGTTSNPTAATPTASFTIKPTGTEADTNGDGVTGDAGDVITYTFTATNTGTVALTNVVIKDPLLPNLTCTIASLPVGATASCTPTNNTYTITAQDVTNGSVNDTANATATPPGSLTPPTATGTTSNPTAAAPTASFTLKKTATVADTNNDGVTGDAGDVITYAFAATNTGTVALTNVKVTDVLLPNLACTIPTLAAGATTSCAATGNTYTITAADATNGSVKNTATATGTPPGNITPPTATGNATTTTSPTPTASFTLQKTATVADTNGDGTVGDAGDVITYAFAATNTGTVALTNVKVTDVLLPNLVCTIPTLAVAATTSCAATSNTYTITATDVTNGSVKNTATATGTPPGNITPPTATGNATTPTAGTPTASFTMKKTATVADTNGDGVLGDAGDTITYAFASTNTGTVALTNVKVTDPLLPSLNCTIPTLAVGATATCAATGNTYVITAADVTAGHVNNTATATATPPGNITPPTSVSTVSTSTAATPVASLALKKTANVVDTNGDGVLGDAGDTITYAFAATNTGTVVLTNVNVTDVLLPNLSCTVATLAAGATSTCAATSNTYVITAADVTAGRVNNTADAIGTPPTGSGIKSPTATGTATTVTASVPTASLTLKKAATVADTNADGVLGDAGDTITYSFSATNTGTTQLTNVTVSDPRLPNLVCNIGTLQAGASGTCAATSNTYLISAADATAGKVDNTATVTGTPPGNIALPTASATVSTPTKTGNAAVTLTKQAAQRDVNVGDLVRYTVVATAAGNAAARDVTLIDTPPAGFTYVQGSLSVVDADKSGTLAGTNPIRVTGVNIPAGGTATITYFLRVGAGVGKGVHTNQAVVDDASGKTLSNVASAEVELTSDPLLDDSLIIGTVFDDRDGDGWQDPAKASNVHVQGGFPQDAYVANSTTVDHGNGPKPEADHSAPMLHGLSLGTVNGRSSTADTAERHQVIISQRLHDLRFTDDFVLTTGEGTTLRMNATGQTTIERTGDARKGLTGQDITVERQVSQTDGGYQVDYIVRDNGIEERGIPGVRVVSVEGLVMETDAYGRFNLQGIDGGAWARGRNFILKVDPSTLPPGSVFTTENPRVLRITPGVPVRFDFGVKLPPGEIEGGHAERDIALGEVLFAAGSAEVKPNYASVLDNIAGKISQYNGGSVTITATAEQQDLAFARAHAVQEALSKRLDPAVRSRLKVNVTVAGDSSPLVSLGQGVHLGTVLFDTNQASIKPAYRTLLSAIAKSLDTQGGGVVTLVGRADHRGTDAYNTQLGLKRAKAVYDALVADLKPEIREKVRVEVSDNPNAPLGLDKR